MEAPPCSGVRSAAAEVGVCMCQGGSTCEGAGSRAKCSTGSMANIFSNLEAPKGGSLMMGGTWWTGHGMPWDAILDVMGSIFFFVPSGYVKIAIENDH